ncbi:MAG: hypothetical protein K0S07_1104 [Chlamydiales bacterium]|jgi:hypothetical protein|nr:hypothetical protein [Chlamydiales bacterium]
MRLLPASPTYYSPYADVKEPAGFSYQAFFDEFTLVKPGSVSFKKDFQPAFAQFLRQFKELPAWSLFIQAWRLFLGNPQMAVFPEDYNAIVEGFRADFDLFIEPYWMAPRDLEVQVEGRETISMDQFFWAALQVFFKDFAKGPVITPERLIGGWHHFLAVNVLIHERSTKYAEYQPLNLPSYEGAYRALLEDPRHFHLHLRSFIDMTFAQFGYFYPSHFFLIWQQWLQSKAFLELEMPRV